MQELNLDGLPIYNVTWNKFIQVKMSLLIWRLFYDKLSTKDNLLPIYFINLDSQLCLRGCHYAETSQHLFFCEKNWFDIL